MRLNSRFIFSIIFVIFFAACSTPNQSPLPADQLPNIGVSKGNMNTKFQIWPEGDKPYKMGDELGIAIHVPGDDPVAFKSDFGLRIFSYEDKKWLEIENLVDFGGDLDGYFLVNPANGNALNDEITVIKPEFPVSHKPTWIRVFCIGNFAPNGQISDQKVAAYVDIEFEP